MTDREIPRSTQIRIIDLAFGGSTIGDICGIYPELSHDVIVAIVMEAVETLERFVAVENLKTFVKRDEANRDD